MEFQYILITRLNPFEVEYSLQVNNPEIERSIYIVKVTHSTIPQQNMNSITLNDKYLIEFLDKNLNSTYIKINQFCITELIYEFQNNYITILVNEEPKVIGHKIFCKRENFEIRDDIKRVFEKISEIPNNVSILTIKEI